ncbi:hypothetical protein SCATT_05330 [Streptantibioticus cattleyicolor NRRL 8057 = DSM 46488]|uniref:Uncharacterized protein n=1 Tax=Streptantibioticus cattleyicolor (strain ATCC 35852 / DSM 46488 / JCM 4925 / NBRC 14057 / NRRL 8057) TaxID=1003195 RepID=G8WR87_STREN|nr:hypothetical protein SCATT_05330 [Streptantibioticus cattleyicolor NRRL 8057 = DSM 46488]
MSTVLPQRLTRATSGVHGRPSVAAGAPDEALLRRVLAGLRAWDRPEQPVPATAEDRTAAVSILAPPRPSGRARRGRPYLLAGRGRHRKGGRP